MKPMKFIKSWKDQFSKKHFKTSKTNPQSSNILILAIFVAYYNRWHQSINWTTIEILIKINLKKALKLNSLVIFFLRFK